MMAVLFVGFANAQTRTLVKATDLQKGITDHFAKNYPGYTIKNAFKVETNKVITYELNAQKETGKITLVYSDKGTFIKAEDQKPVSKATGTIKPTNQNKPTNKAQPQEKK